MTASEPSSHSNRLWVLAGLAPLAITSPLQVQAQAQVIWEPVTESQEEQLQILVPSVDGEATNSQTISSESNATPQSAAPQPIVWELVPEPETTNPSTINPSRSTEVVWEPLPDNPSVARDESNDDSNTVIAWEVLPDTISPLTPEAIDTIAEIESEANNVESTTSEKPPAEVIAQEEAMPPRAVPAAPPPPALQALNRSIAYGDGLVGPDMGIKVPNGFRWSKRWFADASINGRNRRRNGEEFLAWNNGDATAIVHANIIQSGSWSFTINTSFRSVYQGDSAAGGSTSIGEGISSGFRVATNISNTSGIALGGEQILQWDDKTDTGRNFYIIASKGWWLGSQGKDFPVLVANGGIGTGRFVDETKFGCIDNVQNRSGTYAIDNDLCWSPIGSISLAVNEWWGVFAEYQADDGYAGASINLTGGIPLRATWGVKFANNNEIEEFEEMTWVFRLSLGF